MIEHWLVILSDLISEKLWFVPFLALLSGLLTSITPCALTSVPLVIGYVGGTGKSDPKRAFRLSLTFALGMTVVFVALATAAALLGQLMGTSSKWWYIALGILMVLMALQVWGVYNFIPSSSLVGKSTKRGYAGAFIAGILGGLFSSPCATPVLVVLLGIVAKYGDLLWGIILLLLYSAGHSVLVLLAGTSIGFVSKITENNQYGNFSKVLKILMGIVILAIALYMFYLGF